MVQQLALFGSLADKDKSITLKTLASFSGKQPREFQEQVLVWEPTHPFKPKMAAGQVNQIEQYRIFAKTEANEILNYEENLEQLRNYKWSLQVQEVPETGRNVKMISQTVFTTTIQEGDTFQLLATLGYSYKRDYWLQGFEFVLEGTVVRIFRPSRAENGQLSMLDPSGQWVVKVYTLVDSVTDLAAIESASTELLGYQKELRGLFELKLPSRMPFDTRVRSM